METTEADIRKALSLARTVEDWLPSGRPALFSDRMKVRRIARALIACREPVIPDRKFESDGVQFANLGCGDQIDWTMYRPSFCPDCGRPIKWE